MSFGTVYGYTGNPRTTILLAIAKENNLDVTLEQTNVPGGAPPSEEYLKLHPLGKIPTFKGSDGFVLTEVIAITIYLTAQNEKTTLLGKTKQDYASILRWMSYMNHEMLPALGDWFRPLIGRVAYNKKSVDEAEKVTYKKVGVLEKHLVHHTFLVGERLSVADLFACSLIARGYEFVFGKEFRAQYPNVTRWYDLIHHQEIMSSVLGEVKYIDEPLKYTPPKKEPKAEKPKAEKAAKKPAAEEEEEDDKPAEAPKAKHPLEALGKPTLVLDEWKRKYSNEDTRPVALPWFWENYKPDEYSLWRVDYKYNDELTLTFMSANLIGGFFARLEGSRKYIMGSMSVYGANNDSAIAGAFVVRGQEHAPAFDVAPDWESYEFKKLDPANPEDKKFFEDQLAWDTPLKVGDKELPHADGKIFK